MTFAASLSACGGSSANNNTVGGTASADSADGHAAQQSAQAADDGGSADSVAGHSAGLLMAQDLWRAAEADISTSFVLGGCTGSVTTSADAVAGTANANITFDGKCTGKRSVSGTEDITLKFATPTDPNRSLSVTENLTWTLANKDTLAVSSLGAGPTATLISSSSTDSNILLNLTLNEHRVRNAADGNHVFDMNITTADGKSLVVSNTYGSTTQPSARTIVSGTLDVHHNLAKFTATHDFQNVVHSLEGTCACPESGTMVQTVTKDDKSGSFVRTYTFTGCGQASVVTSASTLKDTSNGTAQVTWDDCQN